MIESGLVHYHSSCHGYEEFESEISHSCAIGSTAGLAKPDGLMVVVVFTSTGNGCSWYSDSISVHRQWWLLVCGYCPRQF